MENPENPENTPEIKSMTLINNKCQTCKNYKCICAIKQKINDIKTAMDLKIQKK